MGWAGGRGGGGRKPSNYSKTPTTTTTGHARALLPPLPRPQELRDAAAARSPLGRDVTLREVGETAAFLASDGAAAITGQTLFVDGGYSAVA